jgi:hypothetical protein
MNHLVGEEKLFFYLFLKGWIDFSAYRKAGLIADREGGNLMGSSNHNNILPTVRTWNF